MDKKIIMGIVANALYTAAVFSSRDSRPYVSVLIPVFVACILVSILGAVLMAGGRKKIGAILVCAGCVPFVPVGLIGIRSAQPVLKEERAGFWSSSAPWIIEGIIVLPLLILLGVIAGSPLQEIVENRHPLLVRVKLMTMRDDIPHAFKEAADADDFATLKALVDNTDVGNIPLDMLMRDPELFKYAVDKGADVNARDDFTGRTPLINAMIAITRAQKDIVRLLLDHGADINAGDVNGNTSLMHAVWNFHHFPDERDIEVLNILISRKADVNAANREGTTPLKIAQNIKNPKEKARVIALLKKAGAK